MNLHADFLRKYPETARAALAGLTKRQRAALNYHWPFWARPNQVAPAGGWHIWLILAGRGFGKTRAGAEFIRHLIETDQASRVALVARTPADGRDVMVEDFAGGPGSGLMQICPPWNRPLYEPSKRRLTWPNGATATLYSSAEPRRLRGPQHDALWADELAAWHYLDEKENNPWDMAIMGLRLGAKPRAVVTTTPRPVKILRDLIDRAGNQAGVTVSKGTTWENRSNLAPTWFSEIISRYENTRLGRQELEAELLEDVEGALWRYSWIETNRVQKIPEALIRIVVAVDPAATSGEESSETGIIVAGLGEDGHGYILDDLSLKAPPALWAKTAITAYYRWQADRIIAEVNNGGEMVEHTIRTVDPQVSYAKVTASRGKVIRAEPVAALDEQGKIHHVGLFPELEDQLTTWRQGDKSPDRLDARVWSITELMLTEGLQIFC